MKEPSPVQSTATTSEVTQVTAPASDEGVDLIISQGINTSRINIDNIWNDFDWKDKLIDFKAALHLNN